MVPLATFAPASSSIKEVLITFIDIGALSTAIDKSNGKDHAASESCATTETEKCSVTLLSVKKPSKNFKMPSLTSNIPLLFTGFSGSSSLNILKIVISGSSSSSANSCVIVCPDKPSSTENSADANVNLGISFTPLFVISISRVSMRSPCLTLRDRLPPSSVVPPAISKFARPVKTISPELILTSGSTSHSNVVSLITSNS